MIENPRRLPSKRMFFTSAGLAAAAALSACGGESKSNTPDRSPEGGVAGEVVQPGGESSPIVVETPTVTASPAAIESPTFEPNPAEIPSEYQVIFDGLDSIAAVTDEEFVSMQNTFKQRWAGAEHIGDEYAAILNIASNIKAKQNRETDPAVDQQLQNSVFQIRDILASNPAWEAYYQSDIQAGYFELGNN